MRERRLNLTSETVNFVSSLFDVYNKIISFCHLTSFYFHTMLKPLEISFILSQEQLGGAGGVGGAQFLYYDINYYYYTCSTENCHRTKINILTSDICALNTKHTCGEIVLRISIQLSCNS